MKCGKWENQTAVMEFLLLGTSDYPDHQLLFFLLFLILYLLCLVGNCFIIGATNLDPQLRTPMYFFIGNLSFADVCLTSATVPKYLDNVLSMSLSISFLGCVTQIYLFLWLASTESFLLAVMAYDRYVAICKPLHYTSVMSEKLCVLLVVVSWVLTYFHASLYVSMTLRLCFCGPKIIRSFFCEHPLVTELSCSDMSITQLMLKAESIFIAGLLFLFITGTYAWIVSSILKLRSAEARKKAFFTCSSHLTVIVLFYGACGSVYLFPPSATSKRNNSLVSMMYALVTPMLNPFIYSLWNKEIKAALKRSVRRIICG